MKKYLKILLLLFFIFISGCSQKSDNQRKEYIYENLSKEISKFKDKMTKNSVVINTTFSDYYCYNDFDFRNLIGEESKLVNMKKSPFYFEEKSKNEHYVLTIEGDKIFRYQIPETKTNGTYFVDKSLSDEDSSIDDYFNNEVIPLKIDTNFSYKQNSIEYTDGKYIITGSYKNLLDLLPEDVFEEIKDNYYYYKYKINDATLKFTFSLTKNKLAIEVIGSFPLTQDYQTYEIVTKIDISLKNFSNINFNSPDYYIKAPTSFIDVYEYTNVLEDVITKTSNHQYYLVHLEEGQYYFKEYDYNLKLYLFSLDQKKIDLGYYFGENIVFYGELQNIFTIPTGDYYLAVSSRNSSNNGYKFVLEKIDYNDVFDYNNPIIIEEGELNFEIEGKYDIVYTNFVSKLNGMIKVTNNTDKIAKLYFQNSANNTPKLSDLNDGMLFPIKTGNNYLCLLGDKANYNYTIEFIKVDNYKSKSNNTDILQNNVDDWIVTAKELSTSYFKLQAKEYGIYTFSYTKISDYSSNPNIVIYSSDTNNVIASINKNNEKVLLKEGNYYITVTSDQAGMNKIACKYEQFSSELEEITLTTYNTNTVMDEGFPEYYGVIYANSLDLTYGKKFTLNETSNVLIYSSIYYTIYNSDNIKINVKEQNVSGGIIYNLDPGTYTIEFDTHYIKDVFYKIKIAILTCNIIDDYHYNINNIAEIELGDVKLIKNYYNDVDIIKLSVAIEDFYTINNTDAYFSSLVTIYDDNLNFFTKIENYSLKKINFPVGTYYFLILPNDNKTEVHFSIYK